MQDLSRFYHYMPSGSSGSGPGVVISATGMPQVLVDLLTECYSLRLALVYIGDGMMGQPCSWAMD